MKYMVVWFETDLYKSPILNSEKEVGAFIEEQGISDYLHYIVNGTDFKVQ